jgi:hypothetical protein
MGRGDFSTLRWADDSFKKDDASLEIMERQGLAIAVVALLVVFAVAIELWQVAGLHQQLETQQSTTASLRQEVIDLENNIENNVCISGPPASKPLGTSLQFGSATAEWILNPYEGWVVTLAGSNPTNESELLTGIDLTASQAPRGYLPYGWSLIVNGTQSYGIIPGGTNFTITFGAGGIDIPLNLSSQSATITLNMKYDGYEVAVTLPPTAGP